MKFVYDIFEDENGREIFFVIKDDNGDTVCTAFRKFITWAAAEDFAKGLVDLIGYGTYSVFLA